ncbi:MAG: 3-hydroxyisobutyrate dehydrogenase [Burkholderiaceae bacterium]|nr:3-hydroxyisobutyrate dehydrogenase [Burkholderiaceae bacterium]MCD8517115.1 3-hydroxyisobutyrate dehydrogenase [Burkholderiaceae bacterium]MCD8565528.1 3-hydroxyisobutyrate dehydrogenase [Burkholderiaceae bacterium]
MTTIAFIGLGNMGAPMARNLIKGGLNLRVFDVIESLAVPFSDLGATVCDSAAQASVGAQVVISMLPASQHVQALYLGKDGLLTKLTPGTLVIDCSTIAPDTSRQVAQAANALNLTAIDAPVSGGTNGAQAGTLTFIVGGKPDAVERARPVLELMGSKIFHAGDAGAGQAAKIANNMVLGIQMIATAEALNLGIANGLDPKVLSDIMAQSSGRNWTLEVYNPWPGVMDNVPAARGYEGGFGVDLMLKDLGLAMDAAEQSACATLLGDLAREIYAEHSQDGNGKLDFSSILQMIQKRSGQRSA